VLMPCEVKRGPTGSIDVIICRRGQRSKPCASCGRPSTKLCDYPLTGSRIGETCSRPLCDACATTVGRKGGATIDYCRVHAERHAKSQGAKP